MTSVKSKLFAVKKTRRIGVDAARWSRQPMGETTAEGRLYNRSPRLACLPGVGCIRRKSTAEERLYKLFASRGMGFLQPLFSGRCEWIDVTG